MKFLRKWLWMLPAIGFCVPAGLAAVQFVQGEVANAITLGLTALVLFVTTAIVTTAITGALRLWFLQQGENFLAMFNFRAGGISHRMWQIPLAATLLVGIFCTFKLHLNTATVIHVYGLIATSAFLLLYACVLLLHSKWAKPAFAAVGLVALAMGFYLFNYKSSQVELYNAGIAAMDAGDLPNAIKLFDASILAYKAETGRTQLARLVLPEPSADDEARAHFHKGNCLVKDKKPKDAVKAYIESLSSNPGNTFSSQTTMESAASRFNDALHTMSNLEKLFTSGQGGGKAKGNGKGQGQGPPQPGPGRDRQPAPGAGRQPRDSL
ncbi:MAG: tetratricopeptide repeat protein [Candidatus Melainabacteria bacterium]|nr:tetratricopeptide repeat protein [Candidatus Melainabacteria bacterium]